MKVCCFKVRLIIVFLIQWDKLYHRKHKDTKQQKKFHLTHKYEHRKTNMYCLFFFEFQCQIKPDKSSKFSSGKVSVVVKQQFSLNTKLLCGKYPDFILTHVIFQKKCQVLLLALEYGLIRCSVRVLLRTSEMKNA